MAAQFSITKHGPVSKSVSLSNFASVWLLLTLYLEHTIYVCVCVCFFFLYSLLCLSRDLCSLFDVGEGIQSMTDFYAFSEQYVVLAHP